MKSKTSVILVSGLVMVLVLSGLDSRDAQASSTQKILQYGMNITMTGSGANWGINMERTNTMALEDINASGGVNVAGEKYLWQLVIYDSKLDPAVAVNNIKRLAVKDKVKFQQNTTATCCIPCLPICEEHKIISINVCWGGKAITNPNNFYAFRAIGTSYEVGPILYRWLVKNKGVKTTVVLAPDTESGKMTMPEVVSGAAQNGVKVLDQKFFPAESTEFYPLMTSVLTKNPDVIDDSCTPPRSSGLLLKTARELGYKGIYVSGSAMKPEVLLDIAGKEYCEGCILVRVAAKPLTPLYEKVKNEYLRRWGPPWDDNIAQWNYILYAITKAIEKANTLDTTKIAETLAELEFDTCYGKSKFGGKSIYGIKRQILMPFAFSVIRNGKLEHLFVESFEY